MFCEGVALRTVYPIQGNSVDATLCDIRGPGSVTLFAMGKATSIIPTVYGVGKTVTARTRLLVTIVTNRTEPYGVFVNT